MKSELPAWQFASLVVLALAAIVAAYSNHFRNSFHFDDSHAIQNNVYIRSLSNVPLFFQDGTTSSSVPTNASYRPLSSASYALDYWWGKGLNPVPFHVTQFTLHVLLCVALWFFLRRALVLAGLGDGSALLALLGATLYGIHRVNSETVNYLAQRSEVLSTLGVVGSFAAYQYAPRWRRTFLWLLPAVAGAFAKPSAIMLAPLFLIYLALFPEERESAPGKVPLWVPPLAFSAAFYALQSHLSGARISYGVIPRLTYLQTQTFAWLHYVRLFFLPLGLSADTDWNPITDWYDTRVFAGVFFALALLAAAALYARRGPPGRVFLFGILWYYAALAPSSSLLVLSEMINEHRPYFPYIGLILSLLALAGEGLRRAGARARWAAFAVALLIVGGHGLGTYARNQVWLTEESLWKDVTENSPNNGRAWMNYGLGFMARGDFRTARSCFERALTLTPNYDILDINLGILDGVENHPIQAEQHFQRAIVLNINPAVAHFYYARWLHTQRRDREAADHLKLAVEMNPADMEARGLLLLVYGTLGETEPRCALAQETLRIVPADSAAAAASQGCR